MNDFVKLSYSLTLQECFYEMTIKPIRTIRGTIIYTFVSWYYIINQKIIQNSKVIKKKLNLKNQGILSIEAWFIRKKFFNDRHFSQNNDSEQYLKKQSQRNLMIKLSKKLKNFIEPLF